MKLNCFIKAKEKEKETKKKKKKKKKNALRLLIAFVKSNERYNAMLLAFVKSNKRYNAMLSNREFYKNVKTILYL